MVELAYFKEFHIYYISDLHLDNKKDRNGNIIKIEETAEYLLEQIHCLIANINSNDNNLLVFLGDVSENLNLAYNFFKLLREVYSGRIIYCLGNHECYGAHKKSKEYAESFSQAICALKISIVGIEGKIFGIDKKNYLYPVRYKEDFYTMKYLLYCSTGCGIKDLSHSITFNEEKESKIARKQNKQYHEVIELSKEFKIPLIVMTHFNPEAYLENIVYDKNIYYLCGHTHFNIKKKDLNFYADAQIGYELIPCRCKELFIEEIPHVFENLEDGIHQVSLEDYYSFICRKSSFSMKQPKSNSNYYGEIYMIKKSIYYMFLNESSIGTLSILSGGQKRKASHDLKYYYTHFDEQINLQCYYLRDNWYDYVKKLSEYVKSIGGTGHIHGTIIDIDFYNHIFINPIDKTIMPYYSPLITDGHVERFAYKSIHALLVKHCPELLCNENKYAVDFPLKYSLIEKNNIQLTQEENKIMDYQLNRQFGHKIQRAIENNIISTWIDKTIEKRIETNYN